MEKLRHDLPFWQVPLAKFQHFDKGFEIACGMPTSWGLNVGEHLEYEIGQTISGFAEVVSVGKEQTLIIEPSLENIGKEVLGVICLLKKVN